MRIVSLACSNTEIVAALGCADRLVGVDDHSDFPASVVTPLPRLGPDLDPDVDRVAALDPDLVLATLTVPGHERVVERLEAAGLYFLAPEPGSLEDVYRDVLEIADRLGVRQRGERLVAEMRAGLEPVARPHAAVRPSVLVEWWPRPVIAPGRRSWVHDLLEGAGATHPLAGEAVKSRPLSDAEVAELDPDAIVVSWCGVETSKLRPEVVYENRAWQNVRAVRERRVVVIPEALLGRPAPRLLEGYRALCSVVESIGEPVRPAAVAASESTGER